MEPLLSELSMAKRLLMESLIVFGITLFFLLISATVGISMNTPPASPTAEAADVREHDPDVDHYPIRTFENGMKSLSAD
jgi:hypothetical protein